MATCLGDLVLICVGFETTLVTLLSYRFSPLDTARKLHVP